MCCRIIGGVNVSKQLVNQGLSHMKKGGPDNTGIESIGNVIFGHNRLAIIDLSETGNQPMVTNNSKAMLVFNGEWYSFKEYHPYLTSDSESILSHLNLLGEKGIGDIEGMFSIAFYKNDKIHLWVDRLGEKPMYFYRQGNTFAFASAPAALYSLQDKWELDRDALQSYWLLGSVMGQDSLFKGIKKLCASEHLTYDLESNTIRIERYWEPKFIENAY